MEMLDSPFFELSPVAMWLEDYSEVKNNLIFGVNKEFKIYQHFYEKMSLEF